MINEVKKLILIHVKKQLMYCFENYKIVKQYNISTAKNGLGELIGSECTPRGWHRIYSCIGLDTPINSVFISRRWMGEIYSDYYAMQYPFRDWILTRILQLQGLEDGKNKNGIVDSLKRHIYIHGSPFEIMKNTPSSKGCIRMTSLDVIKLSNWVNYKTNVYIDSDNLYDKIF